MAALVDTGPLVALIDADEDDHELCRTTLAGLTSPLLTTWPVVTEALFLLHSAAGWRGQRLLWDLIQGRDVEIVEISPLVDRVVELMRKYSDQPMSLADATLVAVAEARGVKTIFSLDSDFAVYRYRGREPFRVVP
ncbi:MAG: type II toxin-antitoxin system VapC family toxin [Candidatus Dormibacteria bacterium]